MVVALLRKVFPIVSEVDFETNLAAVQAYDSMMQLRKANKQLAVALVMSFLFVGILNVVPYLLLKVPLAFTLLTFAPLVLAFLTMVVTAYVAKEFSQYMPIATLLFIILLGINLCFLFVVKFSALNHYVVYVVYIAVFILLFIFSYWKRFRNIIGIIMNTKSEKHFPYYLMGVLAYPISKFLLKIATPAAIAFLLLACLLFVVPSVSSRMVLCRYYTSVQRAKLKLNKVGS